MNRPERERNERPNALTTPALTVASIRISNRNRDLPNPQRSGVSKLHRNQVRSINAQHGEIRFGIVADQCRVRFAAIREDHLQFARVMNNVAIG
jgi:hypothetical protein